MIPFLDLSAPTCELRAELDEAYHRFMDSGHYVLGAEVEAFESEWANYCDADHCVGVGSGLDALTLALRAVGVGPGDEVIVPSNTYIATWLAVTYAGATIIPVEPNPDTFNLDALGAAGALTERTKAILGTNLYGQPVDYDSLLSLARENGIYLVIDNAQGHGAEYKSRRVGGIADIECHSFYPTKNLGAFGEAGAVTTTNAEWGDAVRVLRNYGSRIRYENEVCGVNSRIDALQAAFLRVKLRYLDKWNHRRIELAAAYHRDLVGISGLRLPEVPAWAKPVWHLFVILVDQRDQLQQYLLDQGIGTQIHYPIPPHLSRAYRSLGYREFDFPIAEKLAGQVLSLPLSPSVTESEANSVSRAVNNFFLRHNK